MIDNIDKDHHVIGIDTSFGTKLGFS